MHVKLLWWFLRIWGGTSHVGGVYTDYGAACTILFKESNDN